MSSHIFKRTKYLDLGVLILLFLSLGLDKSLAYGQSVGLSGVALVGTCLLIAVLISALIGKMIFARLSWSNSKSIQYVLVVGFLSMALNHLVQSYASHSMDMGEDLVTAKIEYFCYHKFNQPECVRQVNVCPQCVQHIDKWMRDKMADKLKEFRGRYPAQVTPSK